MSNLTVSNTIDSFMQSANISDARFSLNLEGRKSFSGGLVLDGTNHGTRFEAPALGAIAHSIMVRLHPSANGYVFGSNTATDFDFSTEEYRIRNYANSIEVRLYGGGGYNEAVWSNILDEDFAEAHLLFVNDGDGTTPSLYVNGVLASNPTTTASVSAPGWDKSLVADNYTFGESFDASTFTGDLYESAIFTRAVNGVGEAKELYINGILSWLANNPIDKDGTTASAGVLAGFVYDEGIGRQCHDITGRYDAMLPLSGFEHKLPKMEGYVRAKNINVDGSPVFMLEASDILPENVLVHKALAQEKFVDIQVNSKQHVTRRRIRLAPSTTNLIIERSDGSFQNSIANATAVTLSDFPLEIYYTQISR